MRSAAGGFVLALEKHPAPWQFVQADWPLDERSLSGTGR